MVGERQAAAPAGAAADPDAPEPAANHPERPADPPAAPAAETVAAARHRIRFEALVNASYHALREGSLDRRHRLVMAVVVLSGTAAFASMQGAMPAWLQSWLTLAVVAAGVVDMIYDFPGRAREHRDLRARFHSLLARLETCGDADLAALRAEKEQLYAEEPPSNRTLQGIAYNTVVDALYTEDEAPRYRLELPKRAGLFGWRSYAPKT